MIIDKSIITIYFCNKCNLRKWTEELFCCDSQHITIMRDKGEMTYECEFCHNSIGKVKWDFNDQKYYYDEDNFKYCAKCESRIDEIDSIWDSEAITSYLQFIPREVLNSIIAN